MSSNVVSIKKEQVQAAPKRKLQQEKEERCRKVITARLKLAEALLELTQLEQLRWRLEGKEQKPVLHLTVKTRKSRYADKPYAADILRADEVVVKYSPENYLLFRIPSLDGKLIEAGKADGMEWFF